MSMDKQRVRDQYEFLPAALEVRDTPPHPAARLLAWTLILFFVVAVAWASFGRVDVVAIASGRIIPSGRVKVIQPLERGIVREIAVSDGQRVTKGELLIALDPTETEADEARIRHELDLEQGERDRLRALITTIISGSKTTVGAADEPPDPKDRPAAYSADSPDQAALEQQLLTQQLAEYHSQKTIFAYEIEKQQAELQSQQIEIQRLEAVLPIVEQRTQALEKLQRSKALSEHEYLEFKQKRIEKRQDLAVARSRLNEIRANLALARERPRNFHAEFLRTRLGELQEAERRIAALEQEQKKSGERARHQLLTAPIDGIVQKLAVHTIGGVVTPAQELMHLVPGDGLLEVEAWLPNKDVGFVEQGQPAEVKVETFPFTKYGVIDAEITHLSNDAVENERLGLVYALRAKLARNTVQVGDRAVPLTPGMAVTVEIKTGTRRIIEFVLSPVLRGLAESGRER
jgi:hemolysin D